MSTFVTTLVKMGETVSKMMDNPAIPAIVEIGKDMLNVISAASQVVHTDDLPALEQLRDDLEPKVMAHADRTEKTLRGEA